MRISNLILSLALPAATISAYSSPRRNRVQPSASKVAREEGSIFQIPSDRRAALANIAALATSIAISQPAFSADTTSQSQAILEARSAENSLAVPPYGMEGSDIFYPPSFLGTWKVLSKTLEVNAPCGYQLFTGGQAAYNSTVQSEITDGKDLEYKARFVTETGGEESGGGTYIAADREYNAREIGKAAMGAYSIVDTATATPNRYSCLLAPPGGADNLIQVDILALARKSEPVSSEKFVCSEFVRQIVSPAQKNNPNAPPVSPLLVKEIETISIYKIIDKDNFSCRQRTATYLVPSQTDPTAFKKWQLSQGKPVDVRYYDVFFTRT